MSTALAVTSGDPCGIGPEVILKALATPGASTLWAGPGRIAVIGDLPVFERLGRRLPPWRVCSLREFPRRRDRLAFIQLHHRDRFTPGRSGAAAGRASLDYLDAAVTLAKQGAVGALVTAPVTKWTIHRVRPGFEGQTEYLARAFRSPFAVMMFASDRLRIVLLTRHVALRRVAARVTAPLVRRTIRTALDALRTQFGVARPRLAVCGLNPHAGEGGLFGDEERRVLMPVVRALRRAGARIDGPFAADGFFAAQASPAWPAGRYDAVVCWYHDQGLIPFKLAARDAGCQVTLGLPVVRVSPDHGSALDLAGKGLADPGSMRYALRLAASLAAAQRGQTPGGVRPRF